MTMMDLTTRARVDEITKSLTNAAERTCAAEAGIMRAAIATIQALYEALSTPHPISDAMWSAGEDVLLDSREPCEESFSHVSVDCLYTSMEKARVAGML